MAKLHLLCCFSLILSSCFCQTKNSNYDLKKTRLLVQIVGTYLFVANQGIIDADSAMILAGKAERIPYLIAYDEDYNLGSRLLDEKFQNLASMHVAAALLPKLQGENKILLLLKLGAWHLHQTGIRPDDTLKASRYLQQALNMSADMRNYRLQNAALNLLGVYFGQVGNTALAHRYFSAALGIGMRLNNKLLFANTINNEATCLSDRDSSKATLLKEALSIYRQINEKEKQIKVLGELTSVYFANTQLDSVAILTKEAIALGNAIGFRHTHYSYNVLAYVDLIKQDWPGTFRNATIAVNNMEANRDTMFASYFYLSLAQAYVVAQKPDEAVKIFYKVLNSYKEGPLFWYHLFLNAVSTLQGHHKYKEAFLLLQQVTKKYPPETELDKMYVSQFIAISYQYMGEYNLADKYFVEMIRLADKINRPEMANDLAIAYSAAAVFYGGTKQFGRAAYFLKKATALPVERMGAFARRNIGRIRYQIDSAKGNYLLALQEYRQFQELEDSTYNINLINQTNELIGKYETEKKEKDIQLLNGKAQLQQTALAKSNLVKNTTLAGMIVLMVILFLIFRQYRINRRKNQTLGNLLHEKEWLLKEIHHRVKNNLQIVISLLESQSIYVKNDALAAIRDSQHRVYAMALIHQKLYQFEDMQTIMCDEYLVELVDYLKDSLDVRTNIEFVVYIDPVKLDVSQAVPIALILNEAVTNTVKHGFAGRHKGRVQILLELLETSEIQFIISDNGIGLPQGFDIEKADSLGMSLIKGLSDDLEGNLSIESNNGTCIKIIFKKFGSSYLEQRARSGQFA